MSAGQTVLTDPEAVARFLEGLEVRKLPGVGKRREAELEALHLRTCGTLIREAPLVGHVFSAHAAEWLLRAALGLDSERTTRLDDELHSSSATKDPLVAPQKSISKDASFE
eukprot:GHVU01005172.1.p3 GENE.GHVU01005172.1~~GHVU01005172.1.p3  ORF type:complete len:111 (-),score=18.92 GHVU01005172.1:125-457(-)